MSPITIWIAIILGWASGALVNYLGDVLPETRRFSQSHCPQCQSTRSWLDYLFARRCRSCGRRWAGRYWIVQVLFSAASMALWLNVLGDSKLNYWIGLPLLIYLGVVAVIDIEHRVVLHEVSLVGAILGLVLGTYLHDLWLTLLGGVIGFGFMFLLYRFGIFYARRMARRQGQSEEDAEGMGFGDVTLSGVLGLLLGFPDIVTGLFAAILLGGLASLGYILFLLVRKKYEAFAAIPYAPFLVLGACVLLYLH